MAAGVLDNLSNNKLLVAVFMALLAWGMAMSGRVAAVETKTAVHSEQIDRIEKNTDKILTLLQQRK